MGEDTAPLFDWDGDTSNAGATPDSSLLVSVVDDGVVVEETPALVVVPVTTLEVDDRHEREFVEPVRKLNATLNEVLDVDANPERGPEEALAMLKTAMDTFQDESSNWFD